ncbi:hypothetical protein [Tomitella gaofuii]
MLTVVDNDDGSDDQVSGEVMVGAGWSLRDDIVRDGARKMPAAVL